MNVNSTLRCILYILLLGVVPCEHPCKGESGRLTVRILYDDEVTPARAWVDTEDRRRFEPSAPESATPYGKDRSFSCDGVFSMNVPSGKAAIHVEKGKEFFPVDIELEIRESDDVQRDIQLRRWVNMPAKGWYSADLHVHLGSDQPKVQRQLALADDVHLIPSFTYWLRGQGETWNDEWPAADFTRPLRIDPHHIITRNNIEVERINYNSVPGGSIGATFMFNLRRPVTAQQYGEHYPTDAELCRIARLQSPASVFDSDKPSWAETVVGVALGQLDTVQVCHNHYHRETSIPGGFGMIGPLVSGESNSDVGDGLFHRTNDLYYRFLNCGFKLGVSGGSAIGVMAVPTGHNRTYARIEGPLTAEKFWAAVKSGQSFATTGPMLALSANGSPIGSTIKVDSSVETMIRVQTSVESIDKLEALELVHNGGIVASRKLIGEPCDPILSAKLEFDLKPERSGWIASRAIYRAPDGLLRQAHTSPIYISMAGKPVASHVDARYMQRWIEQLVNVANSDPKRFPTASAKKAVLDAYVEAHAQYERIVERSLSQD